ncbi:MAG: hypothetical protein ACPG7D_08305, partial [Candidatus Puniceispirillaceae bacterium]
MHSPKITCMMVQQYLPAVRDGDKRVILIN